MREKTRTCFIIAVKEPKGRMPAGKAVRLDQGPPAGGSQAASEGADMDGGERAMR